MGVILAAIVTILFVYLLQQSLNRKKSKLPPGPLALPLIGHFHLISNSTTQHRDLHRLARKHGPLMHLRLGAVPTLVVSSPAAAELVLKTNDLSFASRPPSGATQYMDLSKKGVTFGKYSPFWRNMRKLMAIELLSQRKVNQFKSVRCSEVELAVSSLKQIPDGQAVDLSDRIFGLFGDIISLMVFGKKGSVSAEENETDRLQTLIMELDQLDGQFNLADFFPFFGALDLQGLKPKYENLSKRFDVFFDKIIDDHQMNRARVSKDFVDMMVDIMESGDAGFEFDRDNIKAVLLDLLIGGSDTIAIAVEWTISELIKNPRTMKKLQEELEAVVGLDRMVDESDILEGRLGYLDCVLREALRLHPVAPLLLHHSVEDAILKLPGDQKSEYNIKKDTRTVINVWAIGRDPEVWTEPESFSPERFTDSKINFHEHHFKLLPFGAGRRGCPGLQLGLVMARLVVAQLVHCFDWKLPDGMLPGTLDMSELYGFVCSRANHLVAVPKYRLHK